MYKTRYINLNTASWPQYSTQSLRRTCMKLTNWINRPAITKLQDRNPKTKYVFRNLAVCLSVQLFQFCVQIPNLFFLSDGKRLYSHRRCMSFAALTTSVKRNKIPSPHLFTFCKAFMEIQLWGFQRWKQLGGTYEQLELLHTVLLEPPFCLPPSCQLGSAKDV